MINRYKAILIITLSLVSSAFLYSQNREQVLKVSFIEKFTNYIHWPESTTQINPDTFIIYVLGNQELSILMGEIYENRKINNKTVKVISRNKLDIDKPIDILYVANGNSKSLKDALDICDLQPFLIISDSDGFANIGAHINFYLTQNNTVHFEMNKHSLDNTGFKTDYLLLEYAKVIMK